MRDYMQVLARCNDGSLWDIRHGLQGVKLTDRGIRGLGMVDPMYEETEGAGVDGVETVGESLPARSIFLPLKFTTQDVEGVQARWWRAIRSGGRLEIEDAHGRARSIAFKFKSDGGIRYAIEPHIWQDQFGVTLQADSPWWLGPTTRTELDTAVDVSEFFGPNGDDAPGFQIANAFATGKVELVNEGDAEAWPIWRVPGPATAYSFAVGSLVLAGSAEVDEGQLLTIYTDPREGRAAVITGEGVDGELDVTAGLTSYGFARIPSGERIELAVNVAGGGIPYVELTPRYHRGIG